MPDKSHTILVTGATGLVGSHLLVLLLKQGYKIRALYRKNSNLKNVKRVFSYYNKLPDFAKIEWILGDVTDIPSLKVAFQGITQVYHCAAVVSFSRKDEALMRKVNIEGTANMVNLSLSQKVQKFCYVSSIATLDKKKNNTVIDETCEWNPENNNYDYAISKYGGEMEVWRGSQEGLNTLIVHPGVILGSGFWETNTGRFFTNAAKGFPYYTTGITGFVGVKEVVLAMIELMESSVVNDHFILVAENRSFKDIMRFIAQGLNTKAPYKKVTPLLANIAWRLAWIQSKLTGKPAFITKHASEAAQKKYYYSSKKLEQTLGFRFPPIKKSIAEFCKHYLADFA